MQRAYLDAQSRRCYRAVHNLLFWGWGLQVDGSGLFHYSTLTVALSGSCTVAELQDSLNCYNHAGCSCWVCLDPKKPTFLGFLIIISVYIAKVGFLGSRWWLRVQGLQLSELRVTVCLDFSFTAIIRQEKFYRALSLRRSP